MEEGRAAGRTFPTQVSRTLKAVLTLEEKWLLEPFGVWAGWAHIVHDRVLKISPPRRALAM